MVQFGSSHLRGARTRETGILDRLLASLDPELGLYDGAAPTDLLIGNLVLCEVLRGIPDAREHAVVKEVSLSFEWPRSAASTWRSRRQIATAPWVGAA